MGNKERYEPSFMRSDNVWVLIPLAALSIPIVAILDDSAIMKSLGDPTILAPLAIIIGLVLAARNLMLLRHRLKLQEIAAQERVALAERDRFEAIENVLEREGVPRTWD